MSALNEPLYELKQDNDYYKNLKKRKDMQEEINNIIDNVAKDVGFNEKDFAYYHSSEFGFVRNSESHKKFEKELRKNADRNGIYCFRKNSKLHKKISEGMKEIDAIDGLVSPWWLVDVFGLNNAKRSQWIGDRFFVETRKEKEPILKYADKVNYKDYLELLMEHV